MFGFSNDDYYYWLVMGILISITSIVGDLVQSQFKRTYGGKIVEPFVGTWGCMIELIV